MTNKKSFTSFITAYFNCSEDSKGNFISNVNGEILNIGIAKDFYDDYLNSSGTYSDYVSATSFEAS